jgi:taurine dioxygenase
MNVYDYQSNNRYMKSTERTTSAPSAVHPIVRTHPETGRKSLFINRLMTDCILEMDTAESTEFLEYLFDHIEQDKYIYDHIWRPGDLSVWDNRCTLHARTDFRSQRTPSVKTLCAGRRQTGIEVYLSLPL